MRIAGVFAQPVENLKKWYDAGARLFIGWASKANTNGKIPAQDRQAQLDWRKAVAQLPGAVYLDYPLPDWKTTPTVQDLDLMAADSACLGVYLPDEPNQKVLNPATQKWDQWRFSVTVLQQYLAPIIAHPALSKKLLVMNLDGTQLTAAWGAYQALDVKAVLDACPQITHVLSDWHPRNNNPARYGDDLPGKAVQILGRFGKKRGAIMECAFEQLPNTVGGRGPTGPEIYAQYQGVVANGPDVEIVAYFPQAPKPNAGHIFDNTTDEQFAMCSKVMGEFAPTPATQPVPAPPVVVPTLSELKSSLEALAQMHQQTRLELAAANAQITTLQDQNKELHARLSTVENRKYTITTVDQ